MPFSHGKFGPAKSSKPGSVKSTGSKAPEPEKSDKKDSMPQQEHGEGMKHVTETHPGMTQPHPTTGVHAVMGMHKGGGKYMSHTHHDGGEVEQKEHPSSSDMAQHMQQAMPDDQQQDPNQQADFSGDLTGIGQMGHDGQM